MKKNRNTQAIRKGFGRLADDARALFTATTDTAEESLDEVRKGLTAALKNGKGVAGRACDVVRRHPYEDIGIALGLGVVVGFLVARRFLGKGG